MAKLIFKQMHTNPPVIQQSRLKRDWMDETYKKHAYQCMPMTVANVMGWEFQIEEDLVVVWDGGNSVPKIISGGTTKSGRMQANASIVGMVSINLGWVPKTEEGISTWITGSPNYFLDGASPLTATIPSWWWPDEVQMNWKITKVGEPVTFPAGSPYCFLTIYEESTMLDTQVEVQNFWSDSELAESRMKYGAMKSKNQRENPWTWTKGIKTGTDADGKQIGPTFTGLPVLSPPTV